MVAEAFTVDLNKPLVFQVGYLGEAYDEWVHRPIVTKDGPRFFSNDHLEILTRTVWWVVPLVWLPVVCWLVSMSIIMGLSPSQLASTLLGGIALWSLLEYSLHRFLFHIKTKSYRGNTIHYLLHGCHHKHPMDRLRLVFPPAAAAILSFPLWTVIKLLTAPSVAPALFGGGLLGYVMYDVTHYYLHHGKPSKGLIENLKFVFVLSLPEILHESSVQNSKQGIWDYFSLLGQGFWNPSSQQKLLNVRSWMNIKCLQNGLL